MCVVRVYVRVCMSVYVCVCGTCIGVNMCALLHVCMCTVCFCVSHVLVYVCICLCMFVCGMYMVCMYYAAYCTPNGRCSFSSFAALSYHSPDTYRPQGTLSKETSISISVLLLNTVTVTQNEQTHTKNNYRKEHRLKDSHTSASHCSG